MKIDKSIFKIPSIFALLSGIIIIFMSYFSLFPEDFWGDYFIIMFSIIIMVITIAIVKFRQYRRQGYGFWEGFIWIILTIIISIIIYIFTIILITFIGIATNLT